MEADVVGSLTACPTTLGDRVPSQVEDVGLEKEQRRDSLHCDEAHSVP